MIKKLKVQSTDKNFKSLEVGVDTVYENSNETKLYDEETKEHIGWEYDQVQYDKNEYIALINNKNKILENELSVTNESVFEIIMKVYD